MSFSPGFRLQPWQFTFSASGECIGDELDTRGITLAIRVDIENPGCYQLRDIFSEPNCRAFGQNEQCEQDWLYTGGNFSDQANYSHVSYEQAAPWPSDNATYRYNRTEMTVTMFQSDDCTPAAERLVWSGCGEGISGCTELPFNVGSLYITGSPDANRTDDCLIAGERAATPTPNTGIGRKASNVLLLGMAIVLGLMFWS